jgi:cytochrome c553
MAPDRAMTMPDRPTANCSGIPLTRRDAIASLDGNSAESAVFRNQATDEIPRTARTPPAVTRIGFRMRRIAMKRFVCLFAGFLAVSGAVRAQSGERVRSASEKYQPVPDIVARGRRPSVAACGSCHLVTGFGRPDNANLAGLPLEYIVQQFTAYKNNQRRSASPRSESSAMAAVARAIDEADTETAARYFAAIEPRPWIRVIEVATVVRDRSAIEPIGTRVVEVPNVEQRTSSNDPPSGFVAYVPPGSLKRGETLVTSGGGGRTVRCALCHGADLRGTASVPGIAGRSPSYLARQLNDMRQGSRFGAQADRMMGTVARLTEEDVVAIVAYAASLSP